MDFALPLLILLGVIIVSGSCLNGITLYLLAFDKNLRKQLSSVRALMLGETLTSLLTCALGVSLILANAIWPTLFQQALILCTVQAIFSFGMSGVSLWYQTIIALTRVAAVFSPHMYKRFVKRRLARVILLCVPWICAYTGVFVLAAENAFKEDASEGLCKPVPYNSSSAASQALFTAYLVENTVHTLLPMLLGLFCYGAIYGRKLYKKFMANGIHTNHNNIVGPAVSSVTATATKAVRPAVTTTGANGVSRAALRTTIITAANTAAAVSTNAADARDKKIRLLASVYVVNFICIAPNYLTFGLGFMDYLSLYWPIIAELLYISAFFAFVVNPLVYYVVSSNFRQALMRLRLHR